MNLRRLLQTAALSAVACVSLSAQGSIFVPDANTGTGGSNVIPFGTSKTSTTWSNQRYQTLIPASFAKNQAVIIRDLGFVPTRTNRHSFDSIKVTIAVTQANNLSSTFATNITTRPIVVLNATNYTVNWTANTWSRLGLQRSFTWVPQLGNLVIDMELRGTGGVGTSTSGFRRSTTIERKYAFGWTTNPPAMGNTTRSLAALKIELVQSSGSANVFGQGCRGSNGIPTISYSGAPALGRTLTTQVSNARANGVAIGVIGFNNSSPFPIDLTSAGAPDCRLYQSPDVLAGQATGTGSFSQALLIPNDPKLVGVTYYQQYFVFEPTLNPLKLVSSNYGRVVIGQ